MAERIRKEHLLAHLQKLVGDRNAFTKHRKLQEAADYIENQFRACGYRTTRDNVRVLWRRYPNIIADSPSALSEAPLLIIGAHYDTVFGSPGADDNASGVAAMLEIARVLCARLAEGPGSNVRVQFVGFTLEEEAMVGSAHYARALQRKDTPLRGMISLEMLGYRTDAPNSQQLPRGYEHSYPRVGNFIGVVGNENSRDLVEKFAAAMKTVDGLPVESLIVPKNGQALPPTRLSDHSPFWDRGYAALMITDTSWFRNPHYHQKSDTVETLDLEFMARIAEGVTRAAEAMLR